MDLKHTFTDKLKFRDFQGHTSLVAEHSLGLGAPESLPTISPTKGTEAATIWETSLGSRPRGLKDTSTEGPAPHALGYRSSVVLFSHNCCEITVSRMKVMNVPQ